MDEVYRENWYIVVLISKLAHIYGSKVPKGTCADGLNQYHCLMGIGLGLSLVGRRVCGRDSIRH